MLPGQFFLIRDLAFDGADLPGLLAEGKGREDRRDDGERRQDHGGHSGELGREDERHGGRLRGALPVGRLFPRLPGNLGLGDHGELLLDRER